MSVVSLANAFKPVSTAEATLYTAATNVPGVPITKFVASNDTTTAAVYQVKIYSSSGSVDHVQPPAVLNRYKSTPNGSLAGCVIPPGGRLVVSVNPANTISFTVSGDV